MMQTDKVPLDRYRLVDTRSVDEARDAIGRIFCPHFLNPTERRPDAFHARHNAVTQQGYSVNFVSYGAAVEIDPGELSRFFLLQLPVRGSARVRCGTSLADVSANHSASILSPTLSTRMTWSEGCEKLIVLIEREAMERQFMALTGRGHDHIEFATAIETATSIGHALIQHMQMMLGASEQQDMMPEAYRVMLRDGLTTLLLTGFAHTASNDLQRPVTTAAPAAVQRAEAFIRENAARPISAAEIAIHSGVSLRSLQDAFRRSRNTTIGDVLLEARLDGFRAGLTEYGATSVADAAFAAGFGHLGRAAQAYRRRFGESPSETLARRR